MPARHRDLTASRPARPNATPPTWSNDTMRAGRRFRCADLAGPGLSRPGCLPGSAAGGLGSDLQVEVPGGQALLLGEAECVPVDPGGGAQGQAVTVAAGL